MIRSYEEFREKLADWGRLHLKRTETGVFMGEEAAEELWQRLGLEDYVERLYMLCRDDARGIAENEMGVDLVGLEGSGDLPDEFWATVQKGVEAGLGGCWDEVMRTALEEALLRAGIPIGD